MKKGLKTAKASAEKREPKVEKQRKKSKGGVGYTAMGLAAGAIPIGGAASKAIPAIAKGVKTIKAGMKAAMKAAGKGKEKVKRGVDKALHYSPDQGPKGAPGVTSGGRTNQSAIIGRKRVADYTKKRRAEGFAVGTGVGVGGSVLVNSMYDSKKKSKKAPSLGDKRQTEADRRKAILKKVQKKKATKAPLPKKKPIRLKKPKEGKSDSSVTVDYSVIDKLKSGGRIKGYKKGGPITYRMTGGQVVDNSYD